MYPITDQHYSATNIVLICLNSGKALKVSDRRPLKVFEVY